MRFGPVPVREAVGAVLAHTVRARVGVWVKGRVLTAEDVTELEAAGIEAVVVARLGPQDVAEDEAARRIALAASSGGVKVMQPFTGRANLLAEVDGVFQADADAVTRLNRVHEALTVSTLPDGSTVRAGDLVATAKVIPLAAPAEAVNAWESVASGGVMRVHPFRARRVGLILTHLPGTSEKLLRRTESVTRDRVERAHSTLEAAVHCPHDAEALAERLRAAVASGISPVLVLGATQIADRADVLPDAVLRAGGHVDHFGLPVDPGNLLLLAHVGDTPVIGMPGCARSLRPSGFDRVLDRLLAGLPVDPQVITAMGAGGLLREVAGRGQPRLGGQLAVASAPEAPRVAGVLLAAGTSSRMGTANKLVEPVGGIPMVRRAASALVAAALDPIVVVTGHGGEAVREALEGIDVRFVENPRFEEGLSRSLAAGIATLSSEVTAAVVALGDMPWVRSEDVRALVEAFDPAADRTICVPVYERKRGNPILFAASHFREIQELSGDVGAKSLLERHSEAVRTVPVDDPGVLRDVDTPDSLRAANPSD